MLVNENDARIEAVLVAQTTVPYDFAIFNKSDIEVFLDGDLINPALYDVTGIENEAGGNVVFTGNQTGTVVILRKQPASQASLYQENEDYPAKRIENDLGKVVMGLQQVREMFARALAFGKKSLKKNTTVDDPVTGQFLRWKDSNGNIDSATPTPSGDIGIPVSLAQGGTGSNYSSLLALATALGTELGHINVKSYGATGDGTTDDTSAIQAAITDAAGRPIYFPAGTYVVTSSLTYTTTSISSGLILLGAGVQKTIFDNRVANGPLLSLDGGGNTTFQHHGILDGFRITTTTSPATSHGINVRGIWNYKFSRLWIDSLTGDGIRNVMVTGDVDSVAHLHITDCRLESNGGYGFNDAETLGVSALSHLIIENCYIRANGSGGIRWSGQMARFTSNSIAQNGGVDGGLFMRHNNVGPQHALVQSCEFDSNSTVHIKIDSGFGAIIDGNQFSFANQTPPGSFGPVTGIKIGDGTNPCNNVTIRNSRIRSIPTNPSVATTMYVISANASFTRIEDTEWAAFSGGNATRLTDAGNNSQIRDDGIWQAGRFQKTGTSVGGGGTYTPDLRTGDIHRIIGTGDFTIAAPTGPAAQGRLLIFSIFNGKGSAITIAMDTIYHRSGGAAPNPTNNTRWTGIFWFDVDSAYWIQLGTWSADITG